MHGIGSNGLGQGRQQRTWTGTAAIHRIGSNGLTQEQQQRTGMAATDGNSDGGNGTAAEAIGNSVSCIVIT
jgi:hypothetical protein